MDTNFFTQIALIILAALGCGLVFEKFKQPAVLGYILAGIILGPSFLDTMQEREFIKALAELGIQMLLFLVGMELNIKSFKSVWLTTILCTILQIGFCLLVVLGLGKIFNWSFGFCILLSCAIALSSTAVSIKMLERINELNTKTGQITIGILIAQDLAIVPIILIFHNLTNKGFDTIIIPLIVISIGLLGILIYYISKKQRIKIPFVNIATKNPDLTPLLVLVLCFGSGSISGLLGFSAPYGSFLCGLVLGNTTQRNVLIQSTKPILSILMMIFFLSIGLLIDLSFIWEYLIEVIILLFFITIGKSFLNIFILHFLNNPWPRAFLSGIILGQIGEFAFLLASISTDVGLINNKEEKLVICLAALSLAISPFWMATAKRFHNLPLKRIRNLKQLLYKIYKPEIETINEVKSSIFKTKEKLEDNNEKKLK